MAVSTGYQGTLCWLLLDRQLQKILASWSTFFMHVGLPSSSLWGLHQTKEDVIYLSGVGLTGRLGQALSDWVLSKVPHGVDRPSHKGPG
jgi:hypothetical protein